MVRNLLKKSVVHIDLDSRSGINFGIQVVIETKNLAVT